MLVFACVDPSLHIAGAIVVRWSSHASLHRCTSVVSSSRVGKRMRGCIVACRRCHRRACVSACWSSCVAASLQVGGAIVVRWSSHASLNRCRSLMPSSCVGLRMRRCIVARRWFHRPALVTSLHRCTSVVPLSCVGLCIRRCIVGRRRCHRRALVFACVAASLHVGGVIVVRLICRGKTDHIQYLVYLQFFRLARCRVNRKETL